MSLNLNLSSNPPASQPGEDGTGGKKKKRKLDLPIVPIKNTADYQRMKLQRLMANPDKPVMIPHRPKDKSLPTPPDFVRNVMGSSAGAGKSAKLEQEEHEFQRKIEEHKKEAELKRQRNEQTIEEEMKAGKRGRESQRMGEREGSDNENGVVTGSDSCDNNNDSNSNERGSGESSSRAEQNTEEGKQEEPQQ
ncbi:PRKR-interacting protein 1 [Orchesella cincta]|uniref:PRKR-interacting protein 1 n=1 Tax=Orchesella cincta TaxID=48709 RepID=A0A1D2MBA2_ORCCI|nr:PRKR-interacting protein 1 [Orchesella cincta]